MGRIYTPTSSSKDWKQFLADPEKQWKDGYSAKSTAMSWESASGLPPAIYDLFERAGEPSPELLLAIPEWKTPLPGGRRESQTDVFALVRTGRGLVATGVEAKVNEPFGPTVSEWLKNASQGKLERISFLRDTLGLSEQAVTVRYQLLHRTASAIIEANRFGAVAAAMIVQSFSPSRMWEDDFLAFVDALRARPGHWHTLPNGLPLLLDWAHSPLPHVSGA